MSDLEEPLVDVTDPGAYVMQRYRVYYTPHFAGVPGLADSPEHQFPEPHATRALVRTFKHRKNAEAFAKEHHCTVEDWKFAMTFDQQEAAERLLREREGAH